MMDINKIDEQAIEYWRLDDLCCLYNELSTSFEKIVSENKFDYNYSYICVSIYASAYRTFKEILILLYHGFPDGAFALSRKVFESMITLKYITQNKNDKDLIKRYFDDYSIKVLQQQNYLNGLDNTHMQILKDLKKFHNLRPDKKAKEYWWTGDKQINYFKDLVEKCNGKEYTKLLYFFAYSKPIDTIHGNMLSAIKPLGRSNILLNKFYVGPTTNGFAHPICISNFSLFDIAYNSFIALGAKFPNELGKRYEELFAFYKNKLPET